MSSDVKACRYYTFPSVLPETHPPILSEVGGKALSLLEMSNSGSFPVPPGLVLSVPFFKPWVDKVMQSDEWIHFVNSKPTKNDDCIAIKNFCRDNLKLTALQQEQLDEAMIKTFGQQHVKSVAVRSSSPEEDLTGTSFAGGYDTVLGVTSRSLLQAIVTCFSSVFDYRIVQYKLQHGMAINNPRIAIIVQKQLASDVSGVAFSINPSNNCYDEVMINANFGLGESVVAGVITPDIYVVDRVTLSILSKDVNDKREAIWLGETEDSVIGTRTKPNDDPKKQALSDDRILEVAKLVEKVEDARGGKPIDIEWAYEGEDLYLLQARPVTAYIPLFPEMLTKRGEQKYLYLDLIVMSQGFSEPLSVLGLDVWKTMLARVKPQFSTEGREGLVWNICGREYIHLSNSMKITGGRYMIDSVYRNYDPALDRALNSINLDEYEPAQTPEGVKGIMWKQLSKVFPLLPSLIVGSFQGDKALDEYKRLSAEFLELCNSDEFMKDASFVDIMNAVLAKFEDMTKNIGAIALGLLSRRKLHNMFAGNKDAEDLLISLCMDLHGNPTSEMGHAMVHLASSKEVRSTDTFVQFLKEIEGAKNGGEDSHFSKEFLTDYNDFMKKYGCRGMKEIDIATPRRYEQQYHFFTELKQIDLEKNAIITTSARRQQAYEKLQAMAKAMKKESLFCHHANIVQSLMGYREHPKYVFVVITGMLRRRALQIASSFMERGRLTRQEDIFYLTVDQVSRAQMSENVDVMALVAANRRGYENVKHVKHWPLLIDSRGKIIRQKKINQHKDMNKSERKWSGTPISPGKIKGRVKVLSEPYEKPLHSGEILVTRFTEPSWTPIFINAAGVIMEVGGPLQHGAIIAREYGIPCVSGVEDATTLVKDGQLVLLDGSEGTLEVIDDESIEESDAGGNQELAAAGAGDAVL